MGICCSSLTTAELEESDDDDQNKLTTSPPECYDAFGPAAAAAHVPPSSSSSFSNSEKKKTRKKMVLRRARVNESGGGKKVQEEGSASAVGFLIRSSSSSSSSAAKAKAKAKTYNKREAAALAEEEEEEVLLSCAPGRLFGNSCSSSSSEVGGSSCLYTQQGRKGINQDAMLLWENFCLKNDAVFCGVFDGHGPFGHMVARRVRDSLPLKLSAQWKAHESNSNNSLIESISAGGSMNSEDAASICVDEECTDSLVLENNDQKPPEIYMMLKQSFLKAYRLMDKELKLHPSIDCFCSGTTAVTFLKKGEDLVIANVGDSRAVLGTRDQEGSLTALQLTVDLKPNLPREAERIQKCKGRVFALQDEPEVARVWLPNNDSPGLAMARAFGDFCLKDFGLISVPDVSYRHLSDKDEFVVLATDGVWDVLTNQEVVDVVDSAPTRAMAARAVVECAVRSWRLKFPTSKSDDCAVVCFFLKDLLVSDTKFVVQEPDEAAAASCTTTAEVPIIQTSQHSDGRVQDTGDHLQHPSTMTVVAPERVIGVEDEIVPAQEIMEPKEVATPPQQDERSYSRRSLAECIMSSEDEEWSALEGVTRVNSLLNLPRLLSRDKSRSSSWRKWL